jgi:catechol 2,3-dioxygenase
MQVRELGHVVLYVRDIERSRHFYRDVLGFPELELSGGADGEGGGALHFPAAAFSTGRTHHELLLIEVGPDAAPLPPGRRVGMYHFGLKVGDSDDDLREALRTVQEHGVDYVGASDHTVTHSLYIRDPDGHEIELYIDVPGVDWRNDPSLIMAPIKALQL